MSLDGSFALVFVFSVLPLGSRVGRKGGGKGGKRQACLGVLSSDEHSESKHRVRVYFRRHRNEIFYVDTVQD